MGKIVAFCNNKGGVAKTSTVATLADVFARVHAKKILVCDLDAQANLTTVFNQSVPDADEPTIFDCLLGYPEDYVPQPARFGINIMVSNLQLSSLERAVSDDKPRQFLLADVLEPYRDKYDYIFLDCPPAIGLLTYNALVAADYMVTPSTADNLSYSGLAMISQLADRIIKTPRLNPKLKYIAIIITKYKLNRLANACIKLIRKDVGDLLISTYVRERTAFERAITARKSIYDYEPDCDTANDYIAVAEELLKRMGDEL